MDKTTLSDTILLKICTVVHDFSGIQITGAHITHITRYLTQYIEQNNLTPESYLEQLSTSRESLNKLINVAAINETYFFREEKQFNLLQKVIFPKYFEQHRPIKIWSAACSTGEEAISLSALAKSFNLNTEIWATDINYETVKTLKNRTYFQNSFRLDGSLLSDSLLTKGTFTTYTSEYIPSPEITQNIHTMQYNLASNGALPKKLANMDIIFMRNVFIYFDENTRKKILLKISNSMKADTLLFLSTSETASILTEKVCPQLQKVNTNNVYYFVKRTEQLKNTNKCIIATKKNNIQHLISITVNPTDYQEFFALVNTELENNNKNTVKQLVHDFTGSINMQDIVAYIRGYVALECGDRIKAEKEFIKAEVINPTLWPAFFLHADILKEKNEKECAKLYIHCKTILKKYIANSQTCYDYLLESFSSSYYYALCCKYLEGKP